MWHDNFISFDTETTGFDDQAHIIELAACWWVDGELKDVFDSRFDPHPIDWESEAVKQAEAVHHITRDQLDGCPTFAQEFVHLQEFLLRAPLLVAHNAQFDSRMLHQEVGRLGKTLEFNGKVVCTLALDRRLTPRPPHKLADSCRRWGVELKDSHSAFGDAKACGYLLLAMQRSGRLPARL